MIQLSLLSWYKHDITTYIISIVSCPSYPVPLLPFAPRHLSLTLSTWFSISLNDLQYPLVSHHLYIWPLACPYSSTPSFRSLSPFPIPVFLHVCLSFWTIYSSSFTLSLYLPILATLFLCTHLICFHCFSPMSFTPLLSTPSLPRRRYHNDHAVMIPIFWW